MFSHTQLRILVRLACVVGVALASLLTATAAMTGVEQQHEIDDKARLSQIFTALDLKLGSVIADVGAGDGQYSVELAKAVGPNGKVLAVDINVAVLDRLRARVMRAGLANVDAIEGAVDNPRLSTGGVDAVLMVHAYHEMTEYAAMLARIRDALKPNGRLVIIEPIAASRRSATRETQTRSHQLAPEFAQQEIRAAGFRMINFADPVPSNHTHDGHSEWMLTAQPETSPPPVTWPSRNDRSLINDSAPLQPLRIVQASRLKR